MSPFRLLHCLSRDSNGRAAATVVETPPALAAWRGTARTSVVGGVAGVPPISFTHGLAMASHV